MGCASMSRRNSPESEGLAMTIEGAARPPLFCLRAYHQKGVG